MDRPVIDHRGPAFAEMTKSVLTGLKDVFRTASEIFVFPGSASGGWEAALVNTLNPGDTVLMVDHGVFANGWNRVAERMGLEVQVLDADWRRAIDPALIRDALVADKHRTIRAVAVVHNETSTGVTNSIAAIRKAMDDVSHPALLMVDAVSSLGSIAYRHDDWNVDVTVAGSQKGLMLPPGLSFNAVSARALDASKRATLPRSYWRWDEMLSFNRDGFFPYTPATTLLYGLREALAMLAEEGREAVFARHRMLADAARAAVAAWGLEFYCKDAEARSDTVTAVQFPDTHDANAFRRVVRDRFNMSLGGGLGKLKGRVVRVGHLGDFNELMLLGTLGGIEMGLQVAGVPYTPGGVQAAIGRLVEHTR